MRTPSFLPSQRSLLYWGGVFAVVIAVVGGILGMHVIGGAQAAPVAPTAMTSTVSTLTPAMPEMTSNHPGPSPMALSHGLPVADVVVGPAGPGRQGTQALCGCLPAGCGATMAMHGACVPTIGPAVLSVPLPGMVTQVHAGTASLSAPGPSSGDRVPDPPSLNQLSISRT
ncbi:DUF6153 family protein [Arthrobacter sp. A2-55]|uniref:DUF6153 family protein n=1 Tax=Arthrobacter sp. A2-55 TaxID=2897337 RepID=UPI0021CD5338|nr:DUF6153 family protein [Arthrobacter sp. A2-55]MCU6482189.1 DUF6153 family protein [Arthrobacter sp. A2-55]